MLETIEQQVTSQFYQWEERLRGWMLFDEPVHPEPGFVPFFFHLPPERSTVQDDGRRHTLVSMAISALRRLLSSRGHQQALPTETGIPICPAAAKPCCTFSIILPKGQKVSPTDTEQLLLMLAACTDTVSFEIVATHEKIMIQVACSQDDRAPVKSQISAYFPNSVLTDTDDTLGTIANDAVHIIDYGLREEGMRPLAMTGSFDPDPYIGLFGILEHLAIGEGAALQILFSGSINPWAESVLRSVQSHDGAPFFADAPEMLPFAKQKVSAPLFWVVIRVVGSATHAHHAEAIAKRVGAALVQLSRGRGNQLVPLSNEHFSFDEQLEDVLCRQTHRFGMLLNAEELCTFVHYPSASLVSTKLERQTKKTKAVPESAMRHPFVLGINEHYGAETPVSLSTAQRLRHVHCIGSTGVGKSTLLLSMIAQDIQQGGGLCVLDPHGDLIEKIVAHIPEHRKNDVLLIDPADAEHPVGFNILSAHSEIEKDILSSDLVAAFRRHSTSWGDQMNSVFANAILAFLESSKGGTLADLRRFLVEKPFRDAHLKTVSDLSIVYYWQREYPLLKSNSIGSILTRLDSFLRPKLIRNMVCQPKSIDFDKLMNEKKIILVKLSQGLIGAENSYLLGTFITSKIHQAALARQATTEHARSDFFLYIDEFQHFITTSMSEILSGTRKYHLGLILAHQSMQQVGDAEIASAIMAAGTRICFRLGEIDAKKLEDGFSFFEAKDLQNLAIGEAIMRIDRPEQDCTLTTIPPTQVCEAGTIKEHIVAHSRWVYGTPREEVEKLLFENMQIPEREHSESVVKPAPVEKKKELTPISQQQSEAPRPVDVTEVYNPVETAHKKEQQQHRYLQTFIKRGAEDRGYKATIEEVTPDGKGKVDVGLLKNDKRIACEISVTTPDTWEVHNVEKCLAAGYETVIVCSTDRKSLEKIQRLVQEKLNLTLHTKVLMLQPEEVLSYLDEQQAKELSGEKRVKGYRVNVEYKTVPPEAARQKREHIIKTITDAIRRSKKDEG